MTFFHVIFIIFDCILTCAIVYAYLPQLRRIRDVAIKGVPPSIDGLSPYYLLFHALYASSLVSWALEAMSSDHKDAKGPLKTYANLASGLPLCALWLCACLMIALFACSYAKTRGKVLVPVLATLHALVFVLLVGDTLRGPKDIGAFIVLGFIEMAVEWLTPIFVVLQAYFQYREMLAAENWRALSLRSFRWQIYVVAALGVRLFVGISWPEALKDGGFLAYTLGAYMVYLPAFNCLLWIGGALVVYSRAMKSGGDEDAAADQDIESGVVLG